MGYDLHITRRQHWTDEGSEISEAEWRAVAEADPGLEVGSASAFQWYNGEVRVKNPDLLTLTKMVELAEKLNARVQGDDGEIYEARYLLSLPASQVAASRANRPWWRRLLG